jgi:hypothetical protein
VHHRGQRKRREDRDDGDCDEKLNQGEGAPRSTASCVHEALRQHVSPRSTSCKQAESSKYYMHPDNQFATQLRQHYYFFAIVMIPVHTIIIAFLLLQVHMRESNRPCETHYHQEARKEGTKVGMPRTRIVHGTSVNPFTDGVSLAH